MKVIINDIDHTGSGITKLDNKITFIPKTIPGDVVEIELIKKAKKYNEGRVISIIKSSKDRINASCPYYSICGGCNISNYKYEKQLLYKKNKVINIFKKYLNISINPEIIPSNSKLNYRNKITLHNNKNLGLVSIDNKIINIDHCSLVTDKINNLINLIKKIDTSKVKKITIREFDNGLTLNIDGQMDYSNIKNEVISIYAKDKLLYQKEKPYIKLDNIKYYIKNDAFFQINTKSITNLYNQIIKIGNFKKTNEIIDLYCGVGSISLYISKYVKSVLGIEIIKNAIDSAKENAKENNIDNAKFICGSVASLIDKNNKADKIIVDPPRNGLDKHTIDVLNNSNTKEIIYVSCDPMTLVRDLKHFTNYTLEKIVLVDMFPQTHHVETVLVLKKKDV